MTASTDNDGRQGLTATSWWNVDRFDDAPSKVGATALVAKCVAELGWSPDFSLQVLDGYQKFLNFRHMFHDYDGNKFYPPIPIGQMWKKHMEDSANYEQDCQLMFGKVHRHEEKLDGATKNRLIERTLYVLRLQCKEDYNRAVWDFGRGELDTAPSARSKRGGLRKTKRVDWSEKLASQETLPRTSKKRKAQDDAAEIRKSRLTEDGCMLPARPARQNANGTFNKPVGRKPAGMEWDYNRGVFAPIAGKQNGAVELKKAIVQPAPKKRAEPALKARKTQDGCIYPAREPKKNADGTFIKPCGRVPAGMEWDENRGVFAPEAVVAPNETGTPRALPFKENKRPRAKSTPETRSRGRMTEDGYYLPPTTPRQADDGTFLRPAGRGPVGMVWDPTRGAYAPFSSSSPNQSVPWVTPTAAPNTGTVNKFNTGSDHSTRMVRRVSQDIEGEQATA